MTIVDFGFLMERDGGTMAGHNLMQAITQESGRDFTAEPRRPQRSAKLDFSKPLDSLRPLAGFVSLRKAL